jgi:hypothetical protein
MIVVTGKPCPAVVSATSRANISAPSCAAACPNPRQTIGWIRDAAQGFSMAGVGANWPTVAIEMP